MDSATNKIRAKQDSVPEAVLLVNGVSKIYQKGAVEVPALRDVDPDIFCGKLVVILGRKDGGGGAMLGSFM
jgi:ABC-type lipoprotein export system ATPase subunit